eukprot:12316721-Ditylum_brightwellii.AAC.2
MQSSNAIISRFYEKLDKTILNTGQVATNLSKTCNKATSLKFQATDSRINNIDKTLHDHDEEIKILKNQISVCSQQKGHFTGTHSTVLKYNDTT